MLYNVLKYNIMLCLQVQLLREKRHTILLDSIAPHPPPRIQENYLTKL